MRGVGAWPPTLDLDYASQATAVLGAIPTRRKGERLHHLAVEGRAETTEVIERRDGDTVHVSSTVLRRRAPHRELAAAIARARDTGQVLDCLERVALRARDPADLLGLERVLDRLLDGALRANRGRVTLLRGDVEGRVEPLVRVECHGSVGRGDPRAAQVDRVLAHRDGVEREASLRVGARAR